MENQPIIHAADILYGACRQVRPVAPLTELYPEFRLEDAYAVQLHNIARAVGAGHAVSGKKIGLTSYGMQHQLGVSEPDYGHLLDAMYCAGNKVDTALLISPKIEAEIAFVLSKDLFRGDVTALDIRESTEYVVAALEIVDSRVADWKIKLSDTVADNASSGRYILGAKKVSLAEIDVVAESMELYHNGELVQQGRGEAVLGDPCQAVAWLANKLWQYGVSLKKGEVILSGAFSAAPQAVKGDRFEAHFSTLGNVEAAFI